MRSADLQGQGEQQLHVGLGRRVDLRVDLDAEGATVPVIGRRLHLHMQERFAGRRHRARLPRVPQGRGRQQCSVRIEIRRWTVLGPAWPLLTYLQRDVLDGAALQR